MIDLIRQADVESSPAEIHSRLFCFHTLSFWFQMVKHLQVFVTALVHEMILCPCINVTSWCSKTQQVRSLTAEHWEQR